jgi:hypothetical protein
MRQVVQYLIIQVLVNQLPLVGIVLAIAIKTLLGNLNEQKDFLCGCYRNGIQRAGGRIKPAHYPG